MGTVRWGVILDVALAGTLFVFAATSFLHAAREAPFHGDESEWINAGRYFKYLVLDRDVSGEVWRPSFITRDQPPLGRYVIGGIVWAAGNDLTAVNRSYAWAKDRATNEREGRVPGPHLLTPVRNAMALVGALAIVCLYVVGRLLDGRLAGLGAGLFATASPLVQLYFVQARTEALLALFTGLGLVAAIRASARLQRERWPGRFGFTAGLWLGLALATKLTASLAIVASLGYGLIAAFTRGLADRAGILRAGTWTLATALLAAIVFVGLNPFLWVNPITRAYSMLNQQRAIMIEQGEQFGGAVVADPLERVWIVISRTFVANATPAFDEGLPRDAPPVIRRTFLDLPDIVGISFELVLASIGLMVIGWRAFRCWWRQLLPGPEVALLCWLAAYFAGIAGNLSLDWPRYYVPTAYLGSVLLGVGAAGILKIPLLLRAGRPVPSAPGRRRPVESLG